MSRTDQDIVIPPAAPPAAPCPRCGGIFEQSVALEDGKVLRGHVPGDAVCIQRQPPILDKRERRRARVR